MSDGEEREQDTEDNPNIDLAHQNSGWLVFVTDTDLRRSWWRIRHFGNESSFG